MSTFDLSTLGLTAGTYSISVKARAEGFADSAESNAVSYTVEGETEETYTLSGTWVFREVMGNIFDYDGFDIKFISNGISYVGITTFDDPGRNMYYATTDDLTDTYVCDRSSGWTNAVYRTIAIEGEQTVSYGTYNFIAAHATKVSGGITFTSNGNGTCYVSGIGTCTDSDLVIPSVSPSGDKVTSIGESAFKDCSSITSVSIPDSVTSIGASAFRNCTSLTSVNIGSWVAAIGNDAFNSCTSLTNIAFNNSTDMWSGVSLGAYCLYQVPATYVTCTDGTVTL